MQLRNRFLPLAPVDDEHLVTPILDDDEHPTPIAANPLNDGDEIDELHIEERVANPLNDGDVIDELLIEGVPQVLVDEINVVRSRFPCPLAGCPHLPLGDMACFRQHVRQWHSEEVCLDIFNVPNESPFVRCAFCSAIMSQRGLRLHRRRCERARVPIGPISPLIPASTQPSLMMPFEEAIGLPVESLKELVVKFSFPLNRTHHTWLTALRLVTVSLLKTMIPNNDMVICEQSTIAYLLIPGTVRYLQVLKAKKGRRVIDFLNGAMRATCTYRYIINYCLSIDLITRRTTGDRTPSLQKEIKAVEKLCADGKYGAGVRRLANISNLLNIEGSTLPVAEISLDAAREKIQALNPSSSDLDVFSPDQLAMVAGTSELTLNWEHIHKVLLSVNKSSAAGWTGWTFATLRAIFTQGSSVEIKANCTLLANIFNGILSGVGCASLWTPCRAGLLPKPQPGEWRSIGICDSLLRVLCRCCTSALSTALGEQLMPLQFGVGIKGGGEIAARLPQLIMSSHPGYVVIKTDQCNAFNRMPRRMILEGVLKLCPQLAKFFVFGHSEAADLMFRGITIGKNATGLCQGGGASSLFYCCGFQSALNDINVGCKAIVERNGNASYVSAYMDDVNVCVHADDASEVSSCMLRVFANYNLPVNVQKCTVVANGGVAEGDGYDFSVEGLPVGFKMVKAGWCVGAPTGTVGCCEKLISDKVKGMLDNIDALRHISAKHAFMMLTKCFNQRPQFLSRVVENHLCKEPLIEFDNSIDNALMRIFNLAESHNDIWFRTIRGLPIYLAGMGIRRYASYHGELACLVSRQIIRSFANKWAPNLVLFIDQTWPTLRISQEVDTCPPWEGVHLSQYCYKSVAVATTKQIEEKCAEKVVNNLINVQRFSCAAIFQSSMFEGSGHWLCNPVAVYSMSDEIFIQAGRNRLMLPIFPSTEISGNMVRCVCGKFFCMNKSSRYHLTASCKMNRWWISNRHSSVVKVIKKFITDVVPSAIVTLEPQVGMLRADIRVILPGGREFILDVVVTHPSRSKSRKEAAKNANVANQQAEDMKRNKYKDTVANELFVPFAVESTGRIGVAGWKWIRTIIGAGPSTISGIVVGERNKFRSQVRHLVKNIVAICDVTCADIVCKMIPKCRQYDSELLTAYAETSNDN